MPRSWDDLFWVAVSIVAGLVVVFAAKHLFRDSRRRERSRWLPVLAGIALMLPAACAERPRPPIAPTPDPVWDNARWAADLRDA